VLAPTLRDACACTCTSSMQLLFSPFDVKRLEAYARNLTDYQVALCVLIMSYS
jgi:hypothetical protein